ncbi:MAG: threonylcarbamoyl-AMP synthase [Desulfamplus sp.]|nr:threonylcarbamoyl-AMP synthase [Desulfamplus sp.]
MVALDYNNNPEIVKAGKIIQNGGVVIFPAKCLYGIAADALNPKAVERVFNIKQRPLTNPILVLIDDINQLSSLVKPLSEQEFLPQSAIALIKKFWPGNITLVFDAMSNVPVELTAGTGKIGVRIPGHSLARELVKQVGRPITGTSANISGRAGCRNIADIDPEILNSVDMILNAGALKGGIGSTVVDITYNQIRIIREGVIASDEIFRAVSGFY